MIKFGYTILYVENIEKTVLFYEEAFGFSQKFMTPEKDYAEMMTGETTLAFASLELGNSNIKNGFITSSNTSKPFGAELVMVCDDVSQTISKAISVGGIIESEATVKPWGQMVGYIRDINGFILEICTPVKV